MFDPPDSLFRPIRLGSDSQIKTMGFRPPYDTSLGMPSLRGESPRPTVQPRVVFVGADPADARLARNVFEDAAHTDLHVVPDVTKAISVLKERPPALLVIDIDLNPGASELLATVRHDPRLQGTPAVLLTAHREEVAEGYRAGASCVLLRPESLDGFFDAMRAVQRFWLEVAELPVD
jgi:CheY-like chemotaxis protein